MTKSISKCRDSLAELFELRPRPATPKADFRPTWATSGLVEVKRARLSSDAMASAAPGSGAQPR